MYVYLFYVQGISLIIKFYQYPKVLSTCIQVTIQQSLFQNIHIWYRVVKRHFTLSIKSSMFVSQASSFAVEPGLGALILKLV